MKSFVQTVRPLGKNIVAASENTVRSFSQQVSDKLPNSDNVAMTYEKTRKEKHTKAILNEEGFSASVSDALFASLLAQRLYHDNTRSNEDIIKACRKEERVAHHPNPESAGNIYKRFSIGGKKALIPAALREIVSAPLVAVGGKDSSQTPKDCSAIVGLVEKQCGVDTPEQLWPLFGNKPPLVYVSQSTTPTLDRYASEGHINYAQGEIHIHPESKHFARTVLKPRFMDKEYRFRDSKDVIPLCGYSFSAGGKQWLTYIHALNELLCDHGMDQSTARQLIGDKIRLAGIALMPDTKGLNLLPGVNTINSVSLYDIGTRPQEEESRVLANPLVLEMIKERAGILPVHLDPQEDGQTRHRLFIFGKISDENFGHSPKGYVEAIGEHALSSQLYQAYFKGDAGEIARQEEEFDKQSISFTKLSLAEEHKVVDRTGLAKWEQWKIGIFTTQIASERNATSLSK